MSRHASKHEPEMRGGDGPTVAAAAEEGSVSQGERAGAGIGKVQRRQASWGSGASGKVKVMTSEPAGVVC